MLLANHHQPTIPNSGGIPQAAYALAHETPEGCCRSLFANSKLISTPLRSLAYKQRKLLCPTFPNSGGILQAAYALAHETPEGYCRCLFANSKLISTPLRSLAYKQRKVLCPTFRTPAVSCRRPMRSRMRRRKDTAGVRLHSLKSMVPVPSPHSPQSPSACRTEHQWCPAGGLCARA